MEMEVKITRGGGGGCVVVVRGGDGRAVVGAVAPGDADGLGVVFFLAAGVDFLRCL